ncbi:hypothetical protein LX36DRAFT_704030 [Colletotrichum falcatum]|nr:hypothetical protein LX36DRAFT_704030 [Colletotrichum falcatum]
MWQRSFEEASWCMLGRDATAFKHLPHKLKCAVFVCLPLITGVSKYERSHRSRRENGDLPGLYQRRDAMSAAMMEALRGEEKDGCQTLSDKDLERLTILIREAEESNAR